MNAHLLIGQRSAKHCFSPANLLLGLAAFFYSLLYEGGGPGEQPGTTGAPSFRSRYCEQIMRLFWLLPALFLLPLPAQADPARDALSEITKCADITAPAERLQCFDTAVGGAKTVLSTPAPAPVQQAAVEPQKTGVQTDKEEEGGILSWFGLSRPVTKQQDFGKPPVPTGPKEIKEISANVLEFAKNAYGRSLFILENGQVWKQSDGDTTEVKDPRSGETMQVTIEAAMFGSYNLRVKGQNGFVKVRRVK